MDGETHVQAGKKNEEAARFEQAINDDKHLCPDCNKARDRPLDMQRDLVALKN